MVVLPQTSYFLVTLCILFQHQRMDVLPVLEPTSSIEIIRKTLDVIHSAKKNYFQAEDSGMRFMRKEKKSISERKTAEVGKVLQ